MAAELKTSDLDSITKQLQHDINCLTDTVKPVRLNAIRKIVQSTQALLADQVRFCLSPFVVTLKMQRPLAQQFIERSLWDALLKVFADPVEKHREMIIEFVLRSVLCCFVCCCLLVVVAVLSPHYTRPTCRSWSLLFTHELEARQSLNLVQMQQPTLPRTADRVCAAEEIRLQLIRLLCALIVNAEPGSFAGWFVV